MRLTQENMQKTNPEPKQNLSKNLTCEASGDQSCEVDSVRVRASVPAKDLVTKDVADVTVDWEFEPSFHSILSRPVGAERRPGHSLRQTDGKV